jgi:hypothetical protein
MHHGRAQALQPVGGAGQVCNIDGQVPRAISAVGKQAGHHVQMTHSTGADVPRGQLDALVEFTLPAG